MQGKEQNFLGGSLHVFLEEAYMLDSTVSSNINMISLSVTLVALPRCSFFIYVHVNFVSELMFL